ncbi:glycosyltransferase family A protein [Longispora albida]|uniref:glycosyltransferase family A protein n=1 Tax=Longispora albida TaxID=203523 RepID=UPI00036CBCB8|nr:glycosyltransferase family A protein [Longispora albida]
MYWPSIGVVIPTHRRPEQLREAVAGVLAQQYPGELRVIVVYDRAEPDFMVAQGGDRPVMVLSNNRTPGLAGARNTGIAALDTDLVAFCDDDDVWLPGKITAQAMALWRRPLAEFSTCAIEVAYNGQVNARLAGQAEVSHADLLRSRMAMLHSSTFLIRRGALTGGLGLVAEDAPGSQNEDWDLLLRAAARHPVVHVDTPLVRVAWGGNSLFARQYDTKISSLRWMLDRHPEIGTSPAGAARVYGQLACWHAAKGDRRQAVRWAKAALRQRWREPRAAIALAAATRIVKVERVVSALHRRGHGI